MVTDVKTKVIKRNGVEVSFEKEKILNAVIKANDEVKNIHKLNEFQIEAIADNVCHRFRNRCMLFM